MVSPNISKKKFKLMQRRIGGAGALNLFFDNCFLYFIRMFTVAQIHKFSSPNDCFHPLKPPMHRLFTCKLSSHSEERTIAIETGRHPLM